MCSVIFFFVFWSPTLNVNSKICFSFTVMDDF